MQSPRFGIACLVFPMGRREVLSYHVRERYMRDGEEREREHGVYYRQEDAVAKLEELEAAAARETER